MPGLLSMKKQSIFLTILTSLPNAIFWFKITIGIVYVFYLLFV